MADLVLGLGNPLMGDDGFGVAVIEALHKSYLFPPQVTLMDGGTLGLDLLPYLEHTNRLLIVDALEQQAPSGTLLRLEGEEVARTLTTQISAHHSGVEALLTAAELLGHLPRKVVVWGVQPATITLTKQLSPPVAAAVTSAVEQVVRELANWGVQPTRNGSARTKHGD